MAGGNQDGKDPADYSIARRMLQGITPPQREESSSPASEPAPVAGSSLGDNPLAKILDALKRAPGKISAVEPEGYGHLLRVRTGGDPLRKGLRGDAVHALEVALRRVGVPDVPSTGRFDVELEAALQTFQRQQALQPSGVFDAESADALHTALGLEEEEEQDQATGAAPRSQLDAAPPLPPTGNAFLDRLAPGAVRGMHESGIPASVLIGMAILESEWGERLLARDHNNLFALTGEGPAGSAIMQESPGGRLVPSGSGTAFRSYHDPADSVADFARSFAKAPDYQGILSHRGQPDSFARALSGTYSPNPQYGSLVQRLMGQFDLYRFDRVAPPTSGW